MKQKGRVAVFLSGRGSNFEALYQWSQQPGANFEIVAVVCDNKNALGLERAEKYGIDTHFVSPSVYKPKVVYEEKIIHHLAKYDVQLICLAGYMRIVGPALLHRYVGRIMNIHPSLLPSFPGLDAQEQAIGYGVKVSGCTVHFVDPGVDTGPVILQKAVEVKDGDTAETLSQRILAEEHQLFGQGVTLFFENRLKISGRKVIIES